MKPTLLVLAAGMGSRYGSLKQMDGVGPHNEAILDYSVFDAIRAGFGKVVFVIRHSFAKDFTEVFTKERFGNRIEVEYVYQELDCLPQGFTPPADRQKPWGTNHAVMMGKSAIDTPFAVINADDFYGAEAYEVLARYLDTLDGSKNRYCVVGYKLKNTLSDFGTVSRGVCTADKQGNLTSIAECYEIGCYDGAVKHKINGELEAIDPESIVSMNMFGYTPDYFDYSDSYFVDFLKAHGQELKSEFLIPTVTNSLIEKGIVTMKVLSSEAKWFGVTYKEDKPIVMDKIKALVAAGKYPENLWNK